MIFSPYRICPIGAHIDHQGGTVLGRTLELGTTVEYQPLESREIRIISRPFGEASFLIGSEIDKNHWACYAQAAAQVLGDRIKRGMIAHVDGKFAGTGLSSSASVGLAYLKALAGVNEIELSDIELVQMDYQLENAKLGLQNGILDPLTIVCGRKDSLLLMDTLRVSVTPIKDPPNQDGTWIIAFSGVSRELLKSGYNNRVAECYEAASLLKPGARKLSDIPPDRFARYNLDLPANLRRRAVHYFSEVERVLEGAEAWKNADLDRFGQLMNQSCQSSISNFETGSPVLIELHEIASATQGVYGSRFSGGGYGGCVVALAKQELAENAVMEIGEQFSKRHPELKPSVFVAEMGDGLRILE
jgi:galactokinase/galacturonokinase